MEVFDLLTQLIATGANGAMIAIALAIYKLDKRVYTLEINLSNLKELLK